jgi:hypothetical protein
MNVEEKRAVLKAAGYKFPEGALSFVSPDSINITGNPEPYTTADAVASSAWDHYIMTLKHAEKWGGVMPWEI